MARRNRIRENPNSNSNNERPNAEQNNAVRDNAVNDNAVDDNAVEVGYRALLPFPFFEGNLLYLIADFQILERILVVLLFFAPIIIILFIEKSSVTFCETEECRMLGRTLSNRLDKSVDPCDNFYDFVCGNHYEDDTPDTTEKMFDLIRDISYDHSPEYLKKLKVYHDSCVYHEVDMKDIKEVLTEMFPWPVLNRNLKWNENQFDWMNMTLRFYKMGVIIDHFLTTSITVDARDTTRTILRLDEPRLDHSSPDILTVDPDDVREYKATIIEAFRLMGAKHDLTQEVDEIMKFESELAGICGDSVNDEITIEDLILRYPKMNWHDYFYKLMSPYISLDTSQYIFIADPFLDRFYDLMTRRKPSNRILANYVLYRAVYTMKSLFIDTTIHKLPLEEKNFECTDKMIQDMHLATSALYLKHNDVDDPVRATKEMTKDLFDKVCEIIENTTWLSKAMKEKLIKKLSMMTQSIGYPMELLNDTLVDDFYRNLVMSSDNYLTNQLSLKRFDIGKVIVRLRDRLDKADWTVYYGEVLESTSRYIFQNGIYVPAGLIEHLYSDIKYVNYAMLGFTISREITYSLSLVNRAWDELGRYNADWWDWEDLDSYVTKAQCLIRKYDNYIYPEYSFGVNGTRTLDQNMADIFGLKVAYEVYTDITKNNDIDPIIKQLQSYTKKQLFWMTFASSFCTSYEDSFVTLAQGDHTPEKYRVIGAVSSLKEFATDFNCKPTDAMNPPEKCPIWF